MSKSTVQLTLKFVFIALCFGLCFSGDYPPSHAQTPNVMQYIAPISGEDAGQDHDIEAINKHLEATDARVAAYNERLDRIGDDVSSLGGWVKGIGSGLGLIEVLAIIFNFKRKS